MQMKFVFEEVESCFFGFVLKEKVNLNQISVLVHHDLGTFLCVSMLTDELVCISTLFKEIYCISYFFHEEKRVKEGDQALEYRVGCQLMIHI